MSLLVNEIVLFLEKRYPIRLAESWDNVGLLIGNRHAEVQRIMTCLTVTPETCREAIAEKANLIISHHPFPFHAVKRITTDTIDGAILCDLIRENIAVYSPHTSFDSASTGINQQIAEKLGLTNIETLYPVPEMGILANTTPEGTGRVGDLPILTTLGELIANVSREFRQSVVPYVGDAKTIVQRIAIGCGAAASFFPQVLTSRADVFLVGEAKFHDALTARANQISMIMPGHFTSERFAVETMAATISEQFNNVFSNVTVWPSRTETDPIQYQRSEHEA